MKRIIKTCSFVVLMHFFGNYCSAPAERKQKNEASHAIDVQQMIPVFGQEGYQIDKISSTENESLTYQTFAD